MSRIRHIFFILCCAVIVTLLLYLNSIGNVKIVKELYRSNVATNTTYIRNSLHNASRLILKEHVSNKTKVDYDTFNTHFLNKNMPDCQNLSVPYFVNFEYTWQTVTKDDMYLYSAFVDGNRIRLVGIWMRTERKRVCQLWYRDNMTSEVTVKTCPAQVVRISGGEGPGRFSTTYVTCQLLGTLVPYAVSILDANASCAEPPNLFPVYIPEVGAPKRFSVCTPPLHNNFPPAYRLIEWIEMNIFLGVQHFTFYNRNSDDLVSGVLEPYRQRGLVEILPWNIPASNLHYLGQIASMHDCLDRNRKRFNYTGFFDLDEFIIPRYKEDITWTDLFKRLPADGCSYSFRSSFFVGNYSVVPYDGNKLDSEFILKQSVLLNVLERGSKLFPHRVRSKIIVKPEQVNTFGVHVTFSCKPGYPNRQVDPSIAMLHHYRRDGSAGGLVNDSTALKYQKHLQTALQNTTP